MKLATKNDSSKLLNLYNQSLAQAKKVGKIDWPDPITQSFIENLVAGKNLYYFERGETIVAAARLSHAPGTHDWPTQAEALYLSRLATADAVRNTNFFQKEMLPAITGYAGTNTKLRLECLADNEPLKAFYRRLGFIPLADVKFYSPQQATDIIVTLFEKSPAT